MADGNSQASFLEQRERERGLPRLNLTVFPAETTGRFVMLTLAALFLIWQTSYVLVLVINPQNSKTADGAQAAVRRATVEVLLGSATPLELARQESLLTGQLTIHLGPIGVDVPYWLVPVCITGAMLAGALLLYSTHPRWLRWGSPFGMLWRYRWGQRPDAAGQPADCTPLLAQAPLVAQLVQEQARQIGIAPPLVEFDPDYLAINGRAYGFRHQGRLLLDGPPLLWERHLNSTNGQRVGIARTILLHELGHIAHRDASWVIFATTMWWLCGTLCIVILGVVTVALGRSSLSQPFSQSLAPIVGLPLHSIGVLWGRLFITLLAVRGMWGGLLRIREFYADDWALGADQRDVVAPYLKRRGEEERQFHQQELADLGQKPWGERWRFLFKLPEEEWERAPWRERLRLVAPRLGAWPAIWKLHPRGERLIRLWQPHPTFQDRFRALSAPGYLFRIAHDLPFLTGLLLAMVLVGFPFLLISLVWPLVQFTERFFLEVGVALVEGSHLRLGHLLLAALLLGLKVFLPLVIALTALFSISLMVIGTLGVQIQREAVIDLVERTQSFTRYFALLKVAGLLVLGLQVGFLFTPFTLYAPTNWLGWAVTPLWIAVFTFLTWLWLFYARVVTRLVIGTHAGTMPPRWAIRGTNLYLSVHLVALYAPLMFALFVLLVLFPAITQAGGPPPFLGPGDVNEWVWGILFLLLSGAYMIYFGGAALSLVLLGGWLFVRQVRCPVCQQKTKHKVVVGHQCESCGSDLAPWVFAQRQMSTPPGQKPGPCCGKP